MNTSTGPVVVNPDPPRHINTSRVVEEDLTYLDEEPEIIGVLPASGWHAVVAGEPVALVAFVALDDASMYGVAVGEDGKVDLVEGNVEKRSFVRYERINDKEK
jgi:hypothetical protein